jgi:hypothetical protein
MWTFLYFIFVQLTDFIQKQFSFIDDYLPEWKKPKFFIGTANDTEQNGWINRKYHLLHFIEYSAHFLH